ncbi:hypothetical protein QO058_27860 [Bosea vestrisii]|uniref:hypothetical protein n=1 Tax=Bosea vestrisii TaxID=151416 RepID=UPI0024E03187|nr:hypothetical protein [Bosea vestrisii]WID96489.1 hypothetical protein QO058_27860 [Bosea vestrisii]
MPGFDTLGVRLARSRRRLERERATVAMTIVREGLEGAEQGDIETQAAESEMKLPMSAQVIAFPRSNRLLRD